MLPEEYPDQGPGSGPSRASILLLGVGLGIKGLRFHVWGLGYWAIWERIGLRRDLDPHEHSIRTCKGNRQFDRLGYPAAPYNDA